MQATYHIKASEVTTSLLTDIKSLFRGEEVLTITVSSEEPGEVLDPIYRFLELEKKYPPKRVSEAIDFNSIVNDING